MKLCKTRNPRKINPRVLTDIRAGNFTLAKEGEWLTIHLPGHGDVTFHCSHLLNPKALEGVAELISWAGPPKPSPTPE